ncbi:TonB-dependent receptor [Xanthomonadaceae bacterium JHOS43]|nr:TonB-dependent receptor [Xanthomonadaceae bacterium JHOS43]
MKRTSVLVGCLIVVSTAAVRAAPVAVDPQHLDRLRPVVVTASADLRDAEPLLPGTAVVDVDAVPSARALKGLSEILAGIPGVVARNRQNFAQDEQISIRGFGARATFGVRGLRLYSDGIPAAMPDGSGQVSHFPLDAAQRIEVLRGPFSALHGSAPGGVIALHSAPGAEPDRWRATQRGGSDAFWRTSLDGRGRAAAMGYHFTLSHLESKGFRDHSAARRETANLRLDWSFDGGRELGVVANRMDQPRAEDPLGLTWEQFRSDPRQTVAAALQFDTRKSVHQQQAGATFRQALGERHSVRVMGYGGTRRVEQFLAIPLAAQNAPLHSGGVVELDSDYHGADLRWQHDGQLGGRLLTLVVGAAVDVQHQARRGYANHRDGVLGVKGVQRRNERNRVEGFDQYVQLDWRIAERWSLMAGARHSAVRFRSEDRYITAANPDDSGRVRHAAVTPVAGLMFDATPAWRVHVRHGRGFETPTFAELAYRADGAAGLAFDLAPAMSNAMEIGSTWRPSSAVVMESAVFRVDTDDELAVARNSGGRTSFRNVASARREGIELALDTSVSDDWRFRFGYTRIAARFRSPFLTCAGTPCLTPNAPVAAGSPIPGVPRSQLFARLAFEQEAWWVALDAARTGTAVVDDSASQTAPAHALAGIEAGRDIGALRLFVRIDNLFDRAHVGSVIVNEGNGRFHEPGPGRQWQLGAQWTF